ETTPLPGDASLAVPNTRELKGFPAVYRRFRRRSTIARINGHLCDRDLCCAIARLSFRQITMLWLVLGRCEGNRRKAVSRCRPCGASGADTAHRNHRVPLSVGILGTRNDGAGSFKDDSCARLGQRAHDSHAIHLSQGDDACGNSDPCFFSSPCWPCPAPARETWFSPRTPRHQPRTSRARARSRSTPVCATKPR